MIPVRSPVGIARERPLSVRSPTSSGHSVGKGHSVERGNRGSPGRNAEGAPVGRGATGPECDRANGCWRLSTANVTNRSAGQGQCELAHIAVAQLCVLYMVIGK